MKFCIYNLLSFICKRISFMENKASMLEEANSKIIKKDFSGEQLPTLMD